MNSQKVSMVPNPSWPTAIEATTGCEMISFAYDVFSEIDSLFLMFGGNKICHSTLKTEIDIYDVSGKHTFASVFGLISDDPYEACVTLSQVRQFAKNNSAWIAGINRPIFFLFKYSGNYFVASISADPNSKQRLITHLFKYDDEFVWTGKIHNLFIIPKQ